MTNTAEIRRAHEGVKAVIENTIEGELDTLSLRAMCYSEIDAVDTLLDRVSKLEASIREAELVWNDWMDDSSTPLSGRFIEPWEVLGALFALVSDDG